MAPTRQRVWSFFLWAGVVGKEKTKGGKMARRISLRHMVRGIPSVGRGNSAGWCRVTALAPTGVAGREKKKEKH